MLMNYKRGKQGISLVEIIVSLVIFSVGMAAVARVFLVGKHFVKEAENKSRAMQIASQQMERYLAYSYKGLESLIPAGNTQAIITGTAEPPYTNFAWQVTLSKLVESISVTGSKQIPYINIEVICNYTETGVSGSVTQRSVRLLNCVPYPYFHIDEFFADHTSSPSPPTATTSFGTIATLSFTNQVPVDLQIIYNITIEAVNGANILPTDTVSTQCKLNGVVQHITTMTPIITQPAISNVLGIVNLGINIPYTVTLEGRVDRVIPGAVIKLKKVSLIAIRAEN